MRPTHRAADTTEQCGEAPALTFDDGVEVVELLMTVYMSAEQGRTLTFRPDGLDAFVPTAARRAWKSGPPAS